MPRLLRRYLQVELLPSLQRLRDARLQPCYAGKCAVWNSSEMAHGDIAHAQSEQFTCASTSRALCVRLSHAGVYAALQQSSSLRIPR